MNPMNMNTCRLFNKCSISKKNLPSVLKHGYSYLLQNFKVLVITYIGKTILSNLCAMLYDSVSQIMVHKPQVLLEVCPCVPSQKTEKNKIQLNCVSHYG